jgi:hypothetical protein
MFAVMVGRTSKGRKGTSWARVRSVLHEVDSGWTRKRVVSGMSSGEGLVLPVRDPMRLQRRGKERDIETETTDPAAPPRRRKRAKKLTGWRLAPPPASPPPG